MLAPGRKDAARGFLEWTWTPVEPLNARSMLDAATSAAAKPADQPFVERRQRLSLPDLEDQSNRAARTAAAKGWRWVGEMEEIAATFAAAGLPDGFHLAAAEVFRTSSSDQERVWPLGETN